MTSLEPVRTSNRFRFIQGDVCNAEAVSDVLAEYRPQIVTHLAAESHVDRSLDGPEDFIQTNIIGTYRMLEAARRYWHALPEAEAERFRFHQISTDEVYGSLGETGLFTEETPYDPRSPYSASKAASDHLVRAYQRTYGISTTVSNCSNNYGPYHFPEKLIPLLILNLFEGKELPVYGDGLNVRDWLFVDDHAEALWVILTRGKVGQTYNVGGNNEWTNIAIVKRLIELVAEAKGKPRAEL